MPQLVKGGKYIFGWTIIKENRKIIIPEEAYFEYKFDKDKNGILISGSKASGGFGLSSKRLMEKSPIGKLLEPFAELTKYQLKEGEIVKIKEKKYSWTTIFKDKSFMISESALKSFKIKINQKLLVGRGSGLALAFIAKGPIYEEARKHPELITF
ncbi:MAG: hypothetical protein ACFFD5_08045 [Candidatus Thorarchaeota archaeon]